MTTYKPGTRVSEYLLEQCIGTGSFGEVWKARHHIWKDEHVAIKLPTEPQYVRYLQREGIVVHGLRHPNIVRVLGMDPFADTPYLVMELVDGPALRQVLDEHPQGLPVDVARVVLEGILRAIATAHANNVLHRDLKPGNVLLNLADKPLAGLEVDDVKVSDFGLGVAQPDKLREIVQSASIDRENTLVGTMAYMAPELRDGTRPADARSDLYSVGVILFELLTGQRPAGAELPSAVRRGVPALFDRLFTRMYARYESRFESAEKALAALNPPTAAPPVPPLPPQRPRAQSVEPPPPPVARGRRTCPHCHQPVAPGDQFCTHCGRQLVPHVRRCPSCGGYPGSEDRFCIFCGQRLPHPPGV